jgi:hypothetical protein
LYPYGISARVTEPRGPLLFRFDAVIDQGDAVTIRCFALLALYGCNLDSELPPQEPLSISELRALPDGPVDVRLEPTHVTYVRQANGTTIFLQTEVLGAAIAVFKGTAEPPLEVAIGNRIELQVTSLTTFGGNKEINGELVLDNDEGAFDVNNLVQLLTVVPDEELESELVRIVGGTIVEASANIFQVRLASNAIVEMFAPSGLGLGLCVGATFDAVGVISEFVGTAGSKHTLQCVNTSDLTNVSLAGCT